MTEIKKADLYTVEKYNEVIMDLVRSCWKDLLGFVFFYRIFYRVVASSSKTSSL